MPLLGSVSKRTFAARGEWQRFARDILARNDLADDTERCHHCHPFTHAVSAAFVDLATLKPARGAVGDDRRGDRTGRYQMTAEIEQLFQLTIGRFGL